jgi:hypothetical protein
LQRTDTIRITTESAEEGVFAFVGEVYLRRRDRQGDPRWRKTGTLSGVGDARLRRGSWCTSPHWAVFRADLTYRNFGKQASFSIAFQWAGEILDSFLLSRKLARAAISDISLPPNLSLCQRPPKSMGNLPPRRKEVQMDQRTGEMLRRSACSCQHRNTCQSALCHQSFISTHLHRRLIF